MKFYCENAEEVLKQMNTSENGLTETEAQKRLEENGKNRLEAAHFFILMHHATVPF